MKKVLLKLESDSLGDTISSIPYVNEYCISSNNEIYFLINERFISLFSQSYPKIKFISNFNTEDFDETINLLTSYTENLQLGFAKQLGFNNPTYIKPKLVFETKERPIKNKYITISAQSTAQMKYWNHPLGKKVQGSQPYWDELCKMLRKKGFTPVCIDRFESFGNPPFFNGTPKNSVKKTGLELNDIVNYLQHCEFFIGSSSGLSWLAHALGKKVVMISNFTEPHYEFDINDNDYIRISDESVCHGCFNKINIDFKFDKYDWYWCPLHKDTERQFECHKSITPTIVMEKINHLL